MLFAIRIGTTTTGVDLDRVCAEFILATDCAAAIRRTITNGHGQHGLGNLCALATAVPVSGSGRDRLAGCQYLRTQDRAALNAVANRDDGLGARGPQVTYRCEPSEQCLFRVLDPDDCAIGS